MNPRIAYVLLEWPRYSETFILNELLELAAHGQPVYIFCLYTSEAIEVPPEFAGKVEWLADASRDVTLSSNELLRILSRRSERFISELEQAFSRFQSREALEDKERQQEPLFTLACAVRLLSRCRKMKIDHLHCHYATLPTAVAEITHKLGGPSYSFTGHAKDIFTMEPSRLGKKIAGAKFVISCSRAGCVALLRSSPESSSQIHCVYHGIRNQEWQIERAPADDVFQIVAVGRLTAKKDFPTLVKALAQLRQRGLSATVEIIGDGRERDTLVDVARSLGVSEHLRLPGKLSQKAIRHTFRSASAFVLPSVILETNNQDGIANAVLEAMAAGVPVVVSDIPALREVVTDGETGLVFPSGDAAILADKLQMLATDTNLGEKCASAAQQQVSDLTCSTAAQQLLGLFERYVTR